MIFKNLKYCSYYYDKYGPDLKVVTHFSNIIILTIHQNWCEFGHIYAFLKTIWEYLCQNSHKFLINFGNYKIGKMKTSMKSGPYSWSIGTHRFQDNIFNKWTFKNTEFTYRHSPGIEQSPCSGWQPSLHIAEREKNNSNKYQINFTLLLLIILGTFNFLKLG